MDDLLLDIEHLSQDKYAMQLKNELKSASCSVATSQILITGDDATPVLQQSHADAPQYRSEMNFQLSLDGDAAVPIITTLSSKSIIKPLSPPTSPLPPLTPPPSPSSAETLTSCDIPEPIPLIGRHSYSDFRDTRMHISDVDGSPLTPIISGAAPTSLRQTNLATIRRRLFASRKPTPFIEADVVQQQHFSSSKSRIGGGGGGALEEQAITLPVSSSSSTKNPRTRRVSIYFNGQSDQAEPSGVKKTHHHHHHRKMSQDSSSATVLNGSIYHYRGKNRRRHSDGGGTGGEDGTGANTAYERPSLSSVVAGGGLDRSNGGCREDSPSSLSTRSVSRSAPRKMSASSYGDDTSGGGLGIAKIPWFACWGNGCI